ELVVGRYQAAVPCELHVPQGAVGAVELVDDAGELACVGKVLAQRQARTAVRGPPPRRHRPPCGLKITQAHPVLELPAARLCVPSRLGAGRDPHPHGPAAIVVHRDRQRRVDLAAREQQRAGEDCEREAAHPAASLALARAAPGTPAGRTLSSRKDRSRRARPAGAPPPPPPRTTPRPPRPPPPPRPHPAAPPGA